MKFRDSIYRRILEDDLAPLGKPMEELAPHFDASLRFLRSIPEGKAPFAYAPGKWSLSEVIGHLLDTRVVFLNRLMYIVRGESVPLPPFDEQLWTESARYGNRTLGELVPLYETGSAFIRSMVAILSPGSLSREGIANDVLISGEEVLLYLIAHEKHHFRVIAERYLRDAPEPGR